MVNTNPSLGIEIAGVKFKNPIILASGTCGYGTELEPFLDLNKVGGISVKGLSLRPHIGASPPRITETPSGMLNAIGLQNIGVEAFLKEKLPRLKQFDTVVMANIWGASIEEYVELTKILNGADGVSMIELNVSCPNVSRGSIEFGLNPSVLSELVSAVCEVSQKPVVVKLSPNVTDIAELARSAEASGAHSVSLINTLRGMVVDVETRRPVLANKMGGLSGPAIRPVAVGMVWRVAQAVKIPVIGIGGIAKLRDVLEFLIVGATAVQVGTSSFVEPGIGGRLATELRDWFLKNSVADIKHLIGSIKI